MVISFIVLYIIVICSVYYCYIYIMVPRFCIIVVVAVRVCSFEDRVYRQGLLMEVFSILFMIQNNAGSSDPFTLKISGGPA